MTRRVPINVRSCVLSGKVPCCEGRLHISLDRFVNTLPKRTVTPCMLVSNTDVTTRGAKELSQDPPNLDHRIMIIMIKERKRERRNVMENYAM